MPWQKIDKVTVAPYKSSLANILQSPIYILYGIIRILQVDSKECFIVSGHTHKNRIATWLPKYRFKNSLVNVHDRSARRSRSLPHFNLKSHKILSQRNEPRTISSVIRRLAETATGGNCIGVLANSFNCSKGEGVGRLATVVGRASFLHAAEHAFIVLVAAGTGRTMVVIVVLLFGLFFHVHLFRSIGIGSALHALWNTRESA